MNGKKQVVPAICLVLCLIFIGLDIFTTYLATPDLKLEANPIVQYFDWGWNSLIIYCLIIFIIMTTLIIFANQYILKYLKSKQSPIILNKSIFIVLYAFVIYFYTVFIGACLASTSNYFSYLYLYQKTDNLFYPIASCFVDFYKKYSVTTYLIVHYSISTLTGILITVYRINRVK